MTEKEIMAILNHHDESVLAGDIEAIVSDYAEDAILIWSPVEKPAVGQAQIREHIKTSIASLDPAFLSKVEITRRQIVGDYCFMMFQYLPVMQGTETYVFRNGKIVFESSVFYFNQG